MTNDQGDNQVAADMDHFRYNTNYQLYSVFCLCFVQFGNVDFPMIIFLLFCFTNYIDPSNKICMFSEKYV